MPFDNDAWANIKAEQEGQKMADTIAADGPGLLDRLDAVRVRVKELVFNSFLDHLFGSAHSWRRWRGGVWYNGIEFGWVNADHALAWGHAEIVQMPKETLEDYRPAGLRLRLETPSKPQLGAECEADSNEDDEDDAKANGSKAAKGNAQGSH